MSSLSTTDNQQPHAVRCRGVRGATTVTENTKEAILAATREMMYIVIPRRLPPDLRLTILCIE